MKKFLFGMPVVAMVVMVSVFCSCGNKGNVNKVEVAADSVAVESTGTDPVAAKGFIESMYKDFFENKNFDTENISNLQKYLSPSVAEKIKMECPYDGGEGDFSYVVDFFCDGALSYERPDYGGKVVSRTIEPEDNDWFLVTNIWDVIKKPVRVHLQVKSVEGAYKIVNIKVAEMDGNADNAVKEDGNTAPQIEGGISIEDAIKVAENMIVENYKFKGFRNSDEVNNILKNKYGYKCEDNYNSYREFDFSPLYYKNCLFAESGRNEDGSTFYNGTPKKTGDGIPSFVGISECIHIAPFTKDVFLDYMKQIKQLGGTIIQDDEDVIQHKLKGFEITGYKGGVFDIPYCITICKE